MKRKVIISSIVFCHTLWCAPALVESFNELKKCLNNISDALGHNKQVNDYSNLVVNDEHKIMAAIDKALRSAFKDYTSSQKDLDSLATAALESIVNDLSSYKLSRAHLKNNSMQPIIAVFKECIVSFDKLQKDTLPPTYSYLNNKPFRSLYNIVARTVKNNSSSIDSSTSDELIENAINQAIIPQPHTAVDMRDAINKELGKRQWLNDISAQEINNFWQANQHLIDDYYKSIEHAKLSKNKYIDDKTAQQHLVHQLSLSFGKIFDKAFQKKPKSVENNNVSIGWLQKLYNWLGTEI